MYIIVKQKYLSIAWWWLPYYILTRLGLWLGLPISADVVAADFVRAHRLKERTMRIRVDV